MFSFTTHFSLPSFLAYDIGGALSTRYRDKKYIQNFSWET